MTIRVFLQRAGKSSIHRIAVLLVCVLALSGCDRETLERRVAEAVNGRPAVVFTDLASGSCLFAVLKHLRALPGVKVVTGVNLAMLVDFVFHVSLDAEAAAERAMAAGTKAIRTP